MSKFAARLDAHHLQAAFDVAHSLVATAQLPSAVLAVATSSELLRVEAFSGEYQAATDSIFPIASISKAILAVSIVQLVQAGTLLLHQPVQYYIPLFQARDVTPWHLLTHTSGLDVDVPGIDKNPTRPTAQDFLEAAYRSGTKFPPGTHVAYNQSAFYVLADLLTRFGGVPYPEYQRRTLFAPLGMHDTSYDPTSAPGRFEWLSTWETVPNAQIPLTREEWTRYTISIASPAFGLWSTAGDLVALGQALLTDLLHGTGNVLSSPYIELMTREHTAGIVEWGSDIARPSYRGLGWGRNQPTLPGSQRVFKHGGSEAGLLWIDPEYDLIYVFLGSRSCRGIEGQFLPLQAVYGAFRG